MYLAHEALFYPNERVMTTLMRISDLSISQALTLLFLSTMFVSASSKRISRCWPRLKARSGGSATPAQLTSNVSPRPTREQAKAVLPILDGPSSTKNLRRSRATFTSGTHWETASICTKALRVSPTNLSLHQISSEIVSFCRPFINISKFGKWRANFSRMDEFLPGG